MHAHYLHIPNHAARIFHLSPTQSALRVCVHPLGNAEVCKTGSPCMDTVQNASRVSYLPVTI